MQDAAARRIADARVTALEGWTLWLIVVFGAAVTFIMAVTIVQTSFIVTAKPGVVAMAIDYRVFWAAGRLGLEGEPLAPFDMARLAAVHNVMRDAWMPWLYPPGYLILLLPFGAVPFAPGFLIFTILSVVLLGLAVRPFVGGSVPVWLAVTLAPAYIPTLILGQNNLFWMAGLLAAFIALRNERWVLAGICIGCLTLKPQLGLLIPIALLAAGLWRTIFAAIGMTVVVAAIPTLFVGLDYWPLMLAGMSEQGAGMLRSIDDLYLMVGPFYILALLGLPDPAITAGLWIIMAACAVIVLLLWRSDRVTFDVKCAGLMLAMLLSAPYLWYYEAAMMVLIGLFMLRAGLIAASPDAAPSSDSPLARRLGASAERLRRYRAWPPARRGGNYTHPSRLHGDSRPALRNSPPHPAGDSLMRLRPSFSLCHRGPLPLAPVQRKVPCPH
jgi:arabinofuranan 3-O-arabinosyltransferase